MYINITVRSADMVIKNLDEMTKRAQAAYRKGVKIEAEAIMAVSQQQVPVSEHGHKEAGVHVAPGHLRDSKMIIYVESANGIQAQLMYLASYSVFVHEIPPSLAIHKVGKWKFLEDPMKMAMPGFAARVAAYVRGALRR